MKKPVTHVLAVMLALAGMTALLLNWLRDPPPDPAPVSYRQGVLPAPPVGQPQTTAAGQPAMPVPLAAAEAAGLLAEALQGTSLRGTQVDRPQLQTVDGQLVLNGTILFYFDYWLSLEGELSPAEISELVRLDLFATYPEAVAAQLFDLFRRYVSYLEEVAAREAAVTREQVLAENLSAAAMQAEVRRQHFSEEEIDGLFGDQERMLARPAQAAQRQKQFDSYRESVAANPAEQERIATEMFGAAAAANLRNVQYRRQEWEGRLANYRREQQLVLEAYPGDGAGQQQAIALLQQRLFSAAEIRRVQALERLRRQPATPPPAPGQQ